jgi:hypothetical protein
MFKQMILALGIAIGVFYAAKLLMIVAEGYF